MGNWSSEKYVISSLLTDVYEDEGPAEPGGRSETLAGSLSGPTAAARLGLFRKKVVSY
jgi:hypothetical protein